MQNEENVQISLLPLPDDLLTFAAAMKGLEEVPTILYSGFEYGASRTAQFRDAECPGTKMEPGLSASLLRFHSIDYLRKEGLDARPTGGDRWTFMRLPFLGISFHYKDMHVRVMKGAKGILPGCGRSEVRRRFFNQVVKPYTRDGQIFVPNFNLIVLWDFDTAYNLSRLWLVLPAQAGVRPKDVRAWWIEPIPHPAEAAGLSPAAAPKPPSAPSDGMDQLIQPKSDGKPAEETNVRGSN